MRNLRARGDRRSGDGDGRLPSAGTTIASTSCSWGWASRSPTIGAVLRAIRILHDPRGLNLGCGASRSRPAAWCRRSESSARSGCRSGSRSRSTPPPTSCATSSCPVNRRWPIRELLDAAREYGQRAGRRVTLEYTLLAGVNDTHRGRRPPRRHRARAAEQDQPHPLQSGARPAVEAADSPRRSSASPDGCYPQAPAVTVRHTLGGEIWAACGQLGGLSPEP